MLKIGKIFYGDLGQASTFSPWGDTPIGPCICPEILP